MKSIDAEGVHLRKKGKLKRRIYYSAGPGTDYLPERVPNSWKFKSLGVLETKQEQISHPSDYG